MDFFDRLATFNWAPVVTALPVLVGAIIGFIKRPRSKSRLDDLLQLHERLPPTHRPTLDRALDATLKGYLHESQRIAHRKIDGTTIATLVVILLLLAPLTWGTIWLSLNIHWLFWILTGILILVLFAFTKIATGQLFKYEDVPDDNPKQAGTGTAS